MWRSEQGTTEQTEMSICLGAKHSVSALEKKCVPVQASPSLRAGRPVCCWGSRQWCFSSWAVTPLRGNTLAVTEMALHPR